ncbi:S-adenosyl-L-methionine-dependent methyltransferase [Mycena venus]|uniref:Arsenite methyltransferase n=1 Tax=Mycena venus TaxID=2733690 RepID=A0A8H6Y0G1_9AGAR|nr:S-adenosyl-L-methionine-dependent methyltransferase [Mycena venus]
MSHYDDAFILQNVKDVYSAVANSGSAPEYAVTVAQAFGYSIEQLESVPKDSHMGLGCGNPTVTATLKPGETVLDLGSGGGIDIFLAASKIGPHGRAIGLDMSSEMVKRARQNATKRDLYPPHVSFLECSLTEALPILSNSVDCVLSNCVINLLPQSGKNHIFREIFRVLKPGGRLVLDDILAKEELPRHIRDDMTQYVSCIGGAVQVHEYRELLHSAGFDESMFVDSLADLNIYIMAAELESAAPLNSCCKIAATASTTVPPQNPGLNLNQWAASYQIYTRKPDQPGVDICDTPLERWWDAFPAVQATKFAKISPTELATMLRNGASVAVIDVRGNDRKGGHVAGSHNFPAQTFYNQLTSFHAQFNAMSTVVFYCSESVGRGPRCAGWYQDYLETNVMSGPNVVVLEGGIKRWITEYSGEKDLVEGNRPV